MSRTLCDRIAALERRRGRDQAMVVIIELFTTADGTRRERHVWPNGCTVEMPVKGRWPAADENHVKGENP